MDPVFDSVDSGRVGGYPVRLPGLWLWLSLIAALLAAAGSVAGLLASDSIYDQETLALADASAARDIVNLVLVAPLMAAIAASASVSDRLETPTGDDMRGEPDVEDPRAPHPWARPFVVIPDHGGALCFSVRTFQWRWPACHPSCRAPSIVTALRFSDGSSSASMMTAWWADRSSTDPSAIVSLRDKAIPNSVPLWSDALKRRLPRLLRRTAM